MRKRAHNPYKSAKMCPCARLAKLFTKMPSIAPPVPRLCHVRAVS